jgi:hypothetical protein
MVLNHSFEDISEIGKGLDVVELGRGEERSDNGPAIAAAVRAGEQMVLAAERNRPVILPMSGRRSRSITQPLQTFQAADAVKASGLGVGRAVRMTSFSVSTTRKNTRPPANYQGQTPSGIASVSKRRWNGGA